MNKNLETFICLVWIIKQISQMIKRRKSYENIRDFFKMLIFKHQQRNRFVILEMNARN